MKGVEIPLFYLALCMEVKNYTLYDNGQPVTYKQSPNIGFGTKDIRFILLHFDAATNDTSAVNWLTDKKSGVSADLHITRAGKVTQMAKFNQITWHAGASAWKGLTGFNKYAIGIEQENAGMIKGVYQDWTEVQIEKCIEVCKALVDAYPSITEILAHSEVATPAGRKDDPGPKFPMARVREAVFGSVTKPKYPITKYTTSDLHIREGAGANFKSLGVLSKGTEVNTLSESNGFSEVFVCSTKQHGWCSSFYLK